MELEKQVVSLELAKRLKELGAKQESLFWWHEGMEWAIFGDGDVTSWGFQETFEHGPKDVSAFTVAELGEILKNDADVLPTWRKEKQVWDDNRTWYETTISDEKEADARAKQLIYLLERGHIKTPRPGEAADGAVKALEEKRANDAR